MAFCSSNANSDTGIIDIAHLQSDAADENKENNVVPIQDSGKIENNHPRHACTPKWSKFGRIVDLFSPVKSGFSSEIISFQEQYQECDRERKLLADELRLQKHNFELERNDLLNSHRAEMNSMMQELNAIQMRFVDLEQQLENKQKALEDSFHCIRKTEDIIAICHEQVHSNFFIHDTLPSTSIADIRYTSANVDSQCDDVIRHQSDLIDRLSLLVAESEAEIFDLKHQIFDLEASLEQEQHQNAEFQNCVQMMEDEILELQVQRDQAVDELKKCLSIPDLELAKAEAELIATECMVELAGAGESLEQATNTIVSLNQNLSHMHSHVKNLSNQTKVLERQIAELVQESESWSKRYYKLVDGPENFYIQIFPEPHSIQTNSLQKIIAKEIEISANFKEIVSASENSLKAADLTRAALENGALNHQADISKVSNYVLAMQSVLDLALQDAQVLVDYSLTSSSRYR